MVQLQGLELVRLDMDILVLGGLPEPFLLGVLPVDGLVQVTEFLLDRVDNPGGMLLPQ